MAPPGELADNVGKADTTDRADPAKPAEPAGLAGNQIESLAANPGLEAGAGDAPNGWRQERTSLA